MSQELNIKRFYSDMQNVLLDLSQGSVKLIVTILTETS